MVTQHVKCGTKTCDKQAVGVVHWPGNQPLPMCHGCGLRATNIAQAMGFTLSVESLDPVVNAAVVALSHAQMFGG